MLRKENQESSRQAVIGADVGGTHTDVAVAMDSRIVRGKALTTYDDFSRGLLEAVSVAAGQLDMTLDELMKRARLFFNGTTVVTNIITQLNGSRVGVLATAGFTDTFRLAGGPRSAEFDDQLQTNVPDIVPRQAIVQIEERIDFAGEVLVPLNREEIQEQARWLVENQDVEAFTVCFLSSYVNPKHELEAELAIKEIYPDAFVTPSHRVFSVSGETRRWTTALLNSYVQKPAARYLHNLDEKLTAEGLDSGLAFFQGLGGAISLERAVNYPLALLGSGPAAGAIGANELGRRMGETNLLLGDMGGTSFDTGIVSNNEIVIEKNLQIGPFQTGVHLVDVVSVGAGGGSIASVSERGVPKVGPRSAGSTPGPAGLGRGGEEATVTDAMIVLGVIDPSRYLGGRIELKPDLSKAALDNAFGERLGWTTEEAAVAVHDLAVVNMANAVREVSVNKGHDPRDFLFLAYGGTLPMFAAQIASRLEIETVVIPQNSSVFCALGLLSSDFVVRSDQAVGWSLGSSLKLDSTNDAARTLINDSVEAIQKDGFESDELEIVRTGDFKFMGQHYELTMPVPDRDLVAEDGAQLADDFLRFYEKTYGEGTAWENVPTTMVNYGVTVTASHPKPDLPSVPEGQRFEPEPREARQIFVPGEDGARAIPIYDDSALTAGAEVSGPAIIDAVDTTIVVPGDFVARRDGLMNLVLSQTGAGR